MPILGVVASSIKASKLGSYESIQTITVGAGGQANVTFSNIPQQYSHLQIRWIAQSNRATYTIDNIFIDRINGSTAGNCYINWMLSNVQTGTQVNNLVYSNYDGVYAGLTGTSVVANLFGAGVTDIFDYTNTSKNKTIKSLSGDDTNGFTASYRGSINLVSGYIPDTTAITTFRIRPEVGTQWNQYSTFALYGIRAT